jgi:hypothetical protein
MEPGRLILRAGPCPTSSLFMMRRREDKGCPIQLLLPIIKPHDWLERGSSSGKRNIGLIEPVDQKGAFDGKNRGRREYYCVKIQTMTGRNNADFEMLPQSQQYFC